MKLLFNNEYKLYEKNGQIFCDSLQIAETFKKQHSVILKIVEGEQRDGVHINGLLDELNQSGGNPRDYFIKDEYKDSRNRSQPKYLLTRDGFTLLVMGFTGADALKYKLEYISRFNQMEQFIKSLLTSKIEFPAFTEAIMLSHDEPKHYHYSNEINMIYRIVLGMDAKKYRQTHNLKDGEVIKPYLTASEIQAIEALQRIDIGLLSAEIEYGRRKDILNGRYQKMRFKIQSA